MHTDDAMRPQTLVSVVTPCFNEVANIEEVCSRVAGELGALNCDFEHIVIDNASTDGTVELLRRLAAKWPHLRVILNRRNFGHLRSPYHAVLQAKGDAVIILAADLQDPPELIPELLKRWRAGAEVVLLVKTGADESRWRQALRRLFYRVLSLASPVGIVRGAHGSGLYSRATIEYLRTLPEPYPFLRGLVLEGGFSPDTIGFHQPMRKAGKSSNGIRNLYDTAMLGLITHSRVLLRMTMSAAILLGVVSALLALFYLVRKLLDWDNFTLGLAPLVIGVFTVASVQLFFLAVMAEYLGDIHSRLRNQPHVVERERLNFD